MKKKTLIIGLVSVFIIAGLIFTFVILKDSNNLEKKMTKIATDYFEEDMKDLASDKIYHLGYFMVSLNDLKGANKDISQFEEKSCNLNDTYAKLTFNDDHSYDVEVHLDCKE